MIEVNRIGKSKRHEDFAATGGGEILSTPGPDVFSPDLYEAFSFQFWGEHCSECTAPDCYFTCDLFERGSTGWCKRFVDGIVVKRCTWDKIPCFYEVIFKPFGRLLAVGNTLCISSIYFKGLAWLFLICGWIWEKCKSMFCFLPVRTQWWITDKMRGAGNRIPLIMNKLALRRRNRANVLVFVIGNSNNEDMNVEVVLSGIQIRTQTGKQDSQDRRIFRRQWKVENGWHRFEVPVSEIEASIDLKKPFRISLAPVTDSMRLVQIAYAGFAVKKLSEAPDTEKREKKIKLLVMDLDNTVWDGIVIENPDAEELVDLLPGVKTTLEELDRRGILLSVAGKGNEADSRKLLEKHGLWNLMLYPQINWGPKSVNIRRIVESLNIGMDTVAFIDDSEFELAEVKTNLPEVRVYRASEFPLLLEREEFDVPVTDESRQRRMLYKAEIKRKSEFIISELSYDEFLASCKMEMTLLVLDSTNKERVHELVQRTNQLNFSARHYSRNQLDDILQKKEFIPVVISCSDRFGDYGIVGFAFLRCRNNMLEIVDMMFSCRIQGKKVEHSFLAYLVRSCRAEELVCFFVRTARNKHAARVFFDLDFTEHVISEDSNRLEYKYVRRCGADTLKQQFPVAVFDKLQLVETINRKFFSDKD